MKTLLVSGNGYGWRAFFSDTLARGLLGIPRELAGFPEWLQKIRWASTFLGQRYGALSYAVDWEEAFCANSELDVDVVNINNLVAYHRALRKISTYELIIILHAATGDSMGLLLHALHFFQKRHGRLAVFIGNEYFKMEEKFRSLRASGADFVISQMPQDIAELLYSACPTTRAFSVPHALNPRLYSPPPEGTDRPIDIGFKGALYPLFIGDDERNQLIHLMERDSSRLSLVTDISHGNIDRHQWANFLRNCKAVIGGESGSYYLDPTGDIIHNARRYLEEHPAASLAELQQACFTEVPFHFSGKCISSRHFEPIGTKTCQVLLEGRYNDILKPDVHYIAVRKDHSNIEEAIQRLKDEDYRRQMVDRTYEYVMAEHTYAHRVRQVIRLLGM